MCLIKSLNLFLLFMVSFLEIKHPCALWSPFFVVRISWGYIVLSGDFRFLQDIKPSAKPKLKLVELCKFFYYKCKGIAH